MKKIFAALVFLLTLCTASLTHASIQGAPFGPEVDARFNCLESGYCATGGPYAPPGFSSGTAPFANLFQNAGGVFGNLGLSYWKADVVINGDVVGTYNTSIVLPAKTIIKQGWFYTKTAILPSGTTTALQCVSANDLLTATDETGVAANAVTALIPTGSAATMVYTSAGCTVKLVTAVHTATAGEWSVFLETVPAQ
jgi:hypothetical protein